MGIQLPSETEGVEPPQVPSIHVGRPLRVLNVVLHHGVQRSDLNSGHTQKIHEQLLNPPLKLRGDPHNNPHMHYVRLDQVDSSPSDTIWLVSPKGPHPLKEVQHLQQSRGIQFQRLGVNGTFEDGSIVTPPASLPPVVSAIQPMSSDVYGWSGSHCHVPSQDWRSESKRVSATNCEGPGCSSMILSCGKLGQLGAGWLHWIRNDGKPVFFAW